MKNSFYDGLKNVFNQLVNRRSGQNNNVVTSERLPAEQMRAIFLTGLGRKIVSLKAGYSLNDTLQFDNDKDKEIYRKALAKDVKKAARFMIAFGRGIIVLHKRGDDLSQPFKAGSAAGLKRSVFSGDMVTALSPSLDLMSSRYQKPMTYSVRGTQIHHTRVIDFTYYEPAELDLPHYQYGGVSEFELIYPQLINDGVIERAIPTIIEKSSSLFYKIEGFKDLMMQKKDNDVVEYFATIADMRSRYTDGLVDAKDQIEVHGQNMVGLAEVDNVSLRRLAMVTGIPLTELIGEGANGLNATGDSERQSLQDTIETLQSDFLLDPINQLGEIYGLGEIQFKDNQGETAAGRVVYEGTVIDNAMKLRDLGEDYGEYLAEKDIVKPDTFKEFFKPELEGGDAETVSEVMPLEATNDEA